MFDCNTCQETSAMAKNWTTTYKIWYSKHCMGRIKRIWYLWPMRAAKVQASLRIRAVSPEPPLLAHTSIESRGTFRQKARSLAPLNGWACAVEICNDGMLEDTNSLDGARIVLGIVFDHFEEWLDWLQSESLICLKKSIIFSSLIFTYGEINFLPKQIPSP